MTYDVKVVFVLRHPCTVIESKLLLDAVALKVDLGKGAGDWDTYPLLKRYLEDEALGNSFLDCYKGDIEHKAWPPRRSTCVNLVYKNILVLGWAQNDNYCLVHCENLVVTGQEEWSRISKAVQIKVGLTDVRLDELSQQASDDFRKSGSPHARISQWGGRLSEQDKRSVQKILDIFGFRVYSAFGAMPMESENEVLSQYRYTRGGE